MNSQQTGERCQCNCAIKLIFLQTQQGPVTCRWLFADNSPFPAGVDVEAGSGQDESRLLFDGWRTDGPFPAPVRIGLIQPQNEEVSWLTVDSTELRQ